jgi:hypothetical protein
MGAVIGLPSQLDEVALTLPGHGKSSCGLQRRSLVVPAPIFSLPTNGWR